MVKRILILTVFILITLVITGCPSSKASSRVSLVTDASSEVVEMEPPWWSVPDPRDGYILGKSEGLSADKGISREKAKNLVVNDLRQKTKVMTEGRSEDFREEMGEAYTSEIKQKFETMQNSIWNGAVENWVEFQSTTVVEKSFDDQNRKRNIYRHYLLVGIDQAAADKKLLGKINRDEQLMTAFKATQAYDKMRADFERYKDELK